MASERGKGLLAIIATGKKAGAKMAGAPAAASDDSGEGAHSAAEALMAALKADDADAVTTALRDFIDNC